MKKRYLIFILLFSILFISGCDRYTNVENDAITLSLIRWWDYNDTAIYYNGTALYNGFELCNVDSCAVNITANGSGTPNYITKWDGSNTLVDSSIFENNATDTIEVQNSNLYIDGAPLGNVFYVNSSTNNNYYINSNGQNIHNYTDLDGSGSLDYAKTINVNTDPSLGYTGGININVDGGGGFLDSVDGLKIQLSNLASSWQVGQNAIRLILDSVNAGTGIKGVLSNAAHTGINIIHQGSGGNVIELSQSTNNWGANELLGSSLIYGQTASAFNPNAYFLTFKNQQLGRVFALNGIGTMYHDRPLVAPHIGKGKYQNLVKYSENLNSSAWQIAGTVSIGNNSGSPSGIPNRGDVISLDGINSGIYQDLGVDPVNETYYLAVWARASTGMYARLETDNYNGTPVQLTGQGFTYFKFEQEEQFPANSTGNLTIRIYNQDGGIRTNSIWGVQVVEGETPTAYVPTSNYTYADFKVGTVTNGKLSIGGDKFESGLDIYKSTQQRGTDLFTINNESGEKVTRIDEDFNVGIKTTNTTNSILRIGENKNSSQAQILLENSSSCNNIKSGGICYSDSHLYLGNGKPHAVVTSAGTLLNTVNASNTLDEIIIYNYSFRPKELHDDEVVEFNIMGVFSTAVASDSYFIRLKLNNVTFHRINWTGGNVDDLGFRITYIGTIRTDGTNATMIDYAEFMTGPSQYTRGDRHPHTIDTTSPLNFSVTVEWLNAKPGNKFQANQGYLIFQH